MHTAWKLSSGLHNPLSGGTLCGELSVRPIRALNALLLVLTLGACTGEGEYLRDLDHDGISATEGDCDDTISSINPMATDIAGDDIDQNCDGVDGTDFDGDGVASVVSGGTDCDDANSAITGNSTYWLDEDRDTFGSSLEPVEACGAPFGYVDNNLDCNDSNADISPAAQEVCDQIDNNCNGLVDNDESAELGTTWYADGDGDGYGNTHIEDVACSAPSGFVGDSSDCNDSDEAYNPGAIEDDCSDPNDYNCDGSVGFADADNDGFPACTDCNDADALSTHLAEDADCDSVVTADDCDDTTASLGALTQDGDCDGYVSSEDCDDADASSTVVATDADCDGIPTNADCDDNDPSSTILATDADCDGAPAWTDCDDTDSSLGAITLDADCDGTLTADDCNDSDAASTVVANDADCDGTTTAEDCNDSDAASTVVANDADCDGTTTAEDCNDNDATSTTRSTDADCDGVITAEDCDDADPASTAQAGDLDCDGTPTADDCDDNDATSTVVANDADCDGTTTAEDCDDNDPTSDTRAIDGDCDGIHTADDCDDTDPSSTIVAEDADCDSTLTADDCDDTDASSTIITYDADCDGVLTTDDCDDTTPALQAIAEDADCDGVLTANDCNDNDPNTVNDMDCDGTPQGDDCDDYDASSTTLANDGDCDGVLTALDCNDNDPNTVDDMDCDGVLTAADCDDTDSDVGAWDNSVETASLVSSFKSWTYDYPAGSLPGTQYGGYSGADGDDEPWLANQGLNIDTVYDQTTASWLTVSADGVLNDGVDATYDSGHGHEAIAWWVNADPTILIDLPHSTLGITSVSVSVSAGTGGVAPPSDLTVLHRQDSSSPWVSVGYTSVGTTTGWATATLATAPVGGQLQLLMSYFDQHTIVGELSLQGSCAP